MSRVFTTPIGPAVLPSPSGAGGETDGAFRLLRLAELAEQLEAGQVRDEALDLAGRVAEGRFYVCSGNDCSPPDSFR
jgi:hypothetical protein